jgi:hypothetical protein
MTESLEGHKIVSESEWIEARKSLLKKEKEFTVLRDKPNQFGLHAQASGMTREQLQRFIENMTHTKRLTTLAELANGLVFASSDQLSGMTGAVLNLTGGKISD